MTRAEEQFLVLGLQRVAASICKTHVGQLRVLIRVLSTWTNYVEYQAEGYACAIIGWAAVEFGFEPPAIPVEFVHDENRYQFIFDIPEA